VFGGLTTIVVFGGVPSDDPGPPVVPGGQKIGLGSRNLRPRAEAHSMGRAVSREQLGDLDGPMV
jgi:hypothetical protein